MPVEAAAFIASVFGLAVVIDFAGWRTSAARNMAERNASLPPAVRSAFVGEDTTEQDEAKQDRLLIAAGVLMLTIGLGVIIVRWLS